MCMKEQMNFSSRESGTSFRDGDRIDTHVANPDLISYEELERRRRQEAYELEARQRMGVEQERPAMAPHDRLGAMSVNLARFRQDAQKSDLDLVA